MYQEASRILAEVHKKSASVKSLCLTSKWKNKKQMYALVLETLKYSNIVDSVLERTNLLSVEKKLRNDRNLARVMVYDFIFGKVSKTLQNDKKTVLGRHRNALNTALARIKIQAGVARNVDLLPESIRLAGQTMPRYVRVNTLKCTTDDVIKRFSDKGFELVTYEKNYNSFVSALTGLTGKQFMKDYHVPNLLSFTPGTDLHDENAYIDGNIILQDKASCLPAYLLNPPPGALVMDCCAAPGNKTTHAAAIMENNGQIFAFDLDKRRAQTMRELCHKAGASCVQVVTGDFLQVSINDPRYQKVEYAIVDPSCSGSGIESRLNSLTDDAESGSHERLEKLSQFQVAVTCHALAFPNVKRLTYSTCSVHARENEHVVLTVLARFPQFELVSLLPTWSHRGLETFEFGKKCIRSDSADHTNGFFVAVFQRKGWKISSNDHSQSESKKKKKRKLGEPVVRDMEDDRKNEANSSSVIVNETSKSAKKRRRKTKTRRKIEDRDITPTVFVNPDSEEGSLAKKAKISS